jgi:hypothetical protein
MNASMGELDDMSPTMKREKGSTFVIIMLVVCFVLIPVIVVLARMDLCVVDRARVQNVVEAAGLFAANDLSRIIINDPNFGYVALSNFPPVGSATVAGDGEPLPVSGINMLVGTLRQNTIIAHELGNTTIAALAEADHECLKRTVEDLNFAVKDSLNATPRARHSDIYGEVISPPGDVRSFLRSNLPNNVKLKSMKLSNGWLAQGGRTTTAAPQPFWLAHVKSGQCLGGKYKSFVDLPVAGLSFSFAGLGSSSTIVSADRFRPADGKHINSILRIECVVELVNQPLLPFGAGTRSQLRCVACCQPYTQEDAGTGGVMTLKLSGAPVPGMQSWSDFLRADNFHDRQVSLYNVAGGDYPADHDSRMWRAESRAGLTTADVFAENLYCWLRNGHCRPKLGAVLEMINESFRAGPAILVYQFERDGSISRTTTERDPFPIGLTADGQSTATIDTSVPGGQNPIIIVRDNVKRLGTVYGGKHAGQPLPAKYLNASFDSVPGVIGSLWSSKREQGALHVKPRKSFQSSCLALAIEIGGTRPSTAAFDVMSMRGLKR